MIRKILKLLIVPVIIVGIAFFMFFQFIITYPHNIKPEVSDVAIVLGCQIWEQEPSPSLEFRLEKALEVYNQKNAHYLIVSGGQGSDEEVPESVVMKKWLVKNGVPESNIIEEDKSTSTYENIKFSKEIMDLRDFKTAIIVTNDFHIFRSMKIAEKLGITVTGAPASSVRYLKAYYISREVFSVLKTYILDFRK